MIETVIAVVTWFVTRRMGQDMSPDVELNNLVSTRESAGFVCTLWLRVTLRKPLVLMEFDLAGTDFCVEP